MSELWYFTSEGKQMEPVTAAELKQLASTGFLRPSDMVWKEGMASWAKASTVPGLFPAAARAANTSSTAVKAREPAAAPQRTSPARPARPARPAKFEVEPIEDRPRDEDRPRRRRDEDDDDDDRPRRRKPKKKGMSGVAIGLIIGGAVLGLFLVCGGIVFATRGGGIGGNDPNNFSVSLNPLQFNSRDVTFNAGALYEISCRSDTRVRRNTVCDVDCYIENAQGQWMSGDDNEGPDSNFRFSPPATGVYRLKVENLDPQVSNRAHVTVRNVGASNVAVLIPPQFPVRPNRIINVFNQGGIPNPFPNPIPNPKIPKIAFPNPKIPILPGGDMTTDPPIQVASGLNFEKMVTYNAPKAVTVRVTSLPGTNDVDLFVTDQQGRDVASDFRVSPDCLVTFQAQANTVYRFRVSNLGPQAANCTLSYTRP